MMTEFKNIRIIEDGSVGEIKTLSEFSVFDCYAKKWSEKPKVIFRNIMLCGLYPNKDFCMGEIRDTEKDYRRLNPFKPENDDKGWFLDLASGARTDGRFTFTRDTTIGKLYYGQPDKDQWKRIIYGSIMHTGCKKLIYKQMKYIVYCNPMRHWGDIQLWENKHEGIYQGAIGTMAAPKLLLLSLGRDTDGDFIQLIKSDKYPGLRDAIANFDKPPVVAKLPKVALTGNLQQIAVNSMTDLTGVVASLLGRARAANAEQIVLKIPPGGEQKQEKEMRIIEFLSQELQIAVDSLKSAYPNNEAGLKAVTDFLNSIGAAAPWLKDFKDEGCYRNRPCAVDPDATDTVSRIVKIVNSYYREPSFGAPISPRDFLSVLFGDVPHDPEQYQHALSERARYRSEMAAASNLAAKQAAGDASLAGQLRSQYMKQVSANFRALKETIFEIPDSNGEKYDRFSWVSAYWKAAHEAETGSAGLVFSTFVDEIIEKLENAEDKDVEVIEVYSIQKSATFDLWKTKRWTGQIVQYQAIYEPLNVDSFGNPGNYKLTIHIRSTKVAMDFYRLGIVGDKYVGKVSVGQTGVMRLCTHRTIDGINKSAKLFAVDTTYEEAQEQLATNFWKEEWPDS